MSGQGDPIRELHAVLDRIAADGGTLRLWWRDDDLEQSTPALGRLLQALDRIGVVPALAAVPGSLRPEALAALAGTGARLFVHGWRHVNHAARGAKKSEFGTGRPLDLRLTEALQGRRRLEEIAGERALPCFVPPWNRLGGDLAERLDAAGFAALSGFAPRRRPPLAATVPRLDTHVDLIDWRGGRLPLTANAVAMALLDRIAPSGAGNDSPVDGPVGILSHHLVTDASAWASWQPLLAALGGHPAVRWLEPGEALAAVGAASGSGTGNQARRTG